MLSLSGLLFGTIVKTDAYSYTGPYLYSACITGFNEPMAEVLEDRTRPTVEEAKLTWEHTTFLNQASKKPLLGIAAGIARMVLAVFHIIGHLIASLNGNRGHLYHAAAGGCEFLRGLIEAIPVIGRIFANLYLPPSIEYRENMTAEDFIGGRSWWMIKMYCTQAPDHFDCRISIYTDSDNYPFYYDVSSARE